MDKINNDIVYILGGNSCWEDNEIRYSLRSVDKFLHSYRNVVIIGRLPDFIDPSKVTHIPCVDANKDKAKNIKKKLVEACNSPLVSEDFMFFNDDYFIVAPIDANKYPYYWKCDLYHTMAINQTVYRNHVDSTIKALIKRNHPLKNFDTHKPIIYNKEQLLNVIYSYDWSINYGYTMRSLYCNTLEISGEYKLDDKIVRPTTVGGWMARIRGIDCFSIEDRAVNSMFKEFIHSLFPDKSRFEL